MLVKLHSPPIHFFLKADYFACIFQMIFQCLPLIFFKSIKILPLMVNDFCHQKKTGKLVFTSVKIKINFQHVFDFYYQINILHNPIGQTVNSGQNVSIEVEQFHIPISFKTAEKNSSLQCLPHRRKIVRGLFDSSVMNKKVTRL